MTLQDSSRGGDSSTSAGEDPVAEILFRALEGPEEGWDAEVARACEANPHLATPIRRRFAHLKVLGLDREGSAGLGSELIVSDVPDRISDYKLLKVLGSGGMGVVYLAEQESMKRLVALKLIRSASLHMPRARQRFRREIEAASRLEHPGICTVFEAGEDDGIPYIAMRYVEGETLAQRIARGLEQGSGSRDSASSASASRGEVAAALDLFEKAARALHAAHEAGLVHRDIKPANLMVTPDGEPVILDFGLAFVEDSEEGSLTLSASSLGTPAYMSPEQVAGTGRVDRRTDVYSLGVALYETLTHKRPFESPTREGLYHQILTSDPPDPRRLGRGISGELKVVLDTALEKDPARRYQTAHDLAEDLRRLQAREPTRARPAGPGLRLQRWMQRNPFGAALLAVLGIGLAMTLVLLRQVSSERTEKDHALTQARASALANASANELAGNPTLALLLAREAMSLEENTESRSRVLSALSALHERQVLHPAEMVGTVAYSPAGDRILMGGSLPQAAFLSTLDGRILAELGPHPSQVQCALFSPDGERIVTCAKLGPAFLWNGAGELIAELPPESGMAWGLSGYVASKAACFSRSGDLLCVGYRSGVVRLFDREGALVAELSGEHQGEVLCVAISPSGEQVASGSRDGRVAVWTTEGAVLARFDHGADATSVSFSPDGRKLLTSSADSTARIRDLERHTGIELLGHEGALGAAVFSPDGTLVATCSRDRTVRLWDLQGRELRRITDYEASVNDVQFSPQGDLVVGCANNGVALVHDLEGRLVAPLRGHADRVTSAAFSPEGDELLTGSTDGTARRWSLAVPDFLELRGHALAVRAGTFAPSGDRIVTGSLDGTCRIVDGAGGLIARVDAGAGVRSVIWARGDRILTGTEEGVVALWDADGSELWSFQAMPDEIMGLDLSSDGSRVLAGGRGGAMTLWSLADDRPEARVEFDRLGAGSVTDVVFLAGDEHLLSFLNLAAVLWTSDGVLLDRFDAKRITCGAVSAQGDRALLGLRDGTLILLDPTSGQLVEVARFEGPGRGVYSLAFSPAGDLIAAGSKDGAIHLWTLEGEPLVRMHHGGIVWSVAFSPQGDRILSTCSRGSARVWPTELDGLAELAEARSVRGFLPFEVAEYADLLGPETEAHAFTVATATDLNLASWEIVRDLGASPEAYAEALVLAERSWARRQTPAAQNTLGVARFRMQRYRQAIDTLIQADERNRAAGEPYGRAYDVAFLAMSHYHLGEEVEARTLLDELRVLTRDETDPEVLGILNEAEELIGGRSGR